MTYQANAWAGAWTVDCEPWAKAVSISITQLQTCINNWQTALVNDSVNPSATYSLATPQGSKMVSQSEWREKLLEDIEKTQRLINKLSPYSIRTLRRL